MEKPIIGITPDYSYEKTRFKISQDYTQSILEAGGIPVLLFPNSTFPSFVDGILFSGGGDIDPLRFGEEPIRENGAISPIRDAYELALCRQALEIDFPIFGICRGMQIMNIAAGGSIYQDISVQTGSSLKHNQQAPRSYATHSIQIVPHSLLDRIWQQPSIAVNSLHHQAVSRLAEGFAAAACSTDGLTEAIWQEEKEFVLGVQWHPESMHTKEQTALFRHFIEAAERHRQKRRNFTCRHPQNKR